VLVFSHHLDDLTPHHPVESSPSTTSLTNKTITKTFTKTKNNQGDGTGTSSGCGRPLSFQLA
jgi:hypothetical protein